MLSLTRQLYNDFEFVYKTNRTTDLSIFFRVAFMTALIPNPCAIAFNLAIKILHIIRLHFIEDQCRIFALLVILARQII